MTILRFRPRIDPDAVASSLLGALAESRGIDAAEVANAFLLTHPDLRSAGIVEVCAFAGKVVASFERVLLKQVGDAGDVA
jgi:hypothetical protein